MADELRNIKLTLEYDGAGLGGWQRQVGQPTVQSCLEEALSKIMGEPVTVIGAGRTDAGVHAKGQVAHFKTAAERSLTAIVNGGNAMLPRQIAIRSAEDVPSDFHARYSAKSKIYWYDLEISPIRPALRRGYVWHQTPGLDLPAMQACLEVLLGEHDFAAFQSTGTVVRHTVRQMMTAELVAGPEGLVRITLEADGFLRHMVRAIVGTLVQAGRGAVSPSDFKRILESRDRSQAGPTAPPQGLFLVRVNY